jgi:hypothetical protein
VAWSLRAGPGNGDGGGTWADNATAERREACLPVAREGSCLASVASRVTARHVQGWTSLGAPPIPSLGGRQRRRREKEKEKNPDAERAGTEETGLFDIVNREWRERRSGMSCSEPIASAATRSGLRPRARLGAPSCRPLRRSGAVATSAATLRLPGRVSHARGTAEYRRRDQAVGRAAEEASLTSIRRARAWPSSTSRRRIPRSGTTSSARSG